MPGKDGAGAAGRGRRDPRAAAGPSQIDRYQRQRNVTFTAELNGRPLGEVMSEVQKLPSVQQLPPGVGFLNTGDAEIFVELFVGFAIAMVAGLVCIYMVLLLLFNHAMQPLTILTAVPLCAGGAFGALLITQNVLSLPALIGLLMLIGIATKNSILLVDYAVMAEDEHGMSAARRAGRRLPQARAAGDHDHARDGRRHAADRARASLATRASARRWRSR